MSRYSDLFFILFIALWVSALTALCALIDGSAWSVAVAFLSAGLVFGFSALAGEW